VFTRTQKLIICLCVVGVVAVLWVRPMVGFRTIPPVRRGDGNTAAQIPDILTLHYHQRAPYYFAEGSRVAGLVAGLVDAALTSAGVPFRWEQTPPKRQLEILKADKGLHCAVGWFYTPQRATFAAFSIPVYQDRPLVAAFRKADADKIRYDSVEALLADRSLTLLVRDGYSYGQFLDEMIEHHAPPQVLAGVDTDAMLRMIVAGRADYMFLTPEELSAVALAGSLFREALASEEFADMPAGNTRYLLFNRSADYATVARVNAAIEAELARRGIVFHHD